MAIITADSWDEFADGTLFYLNNDASQNKFSYVNSYKPHRLSVVNSAFSASNNPATGTPYRVNNAVNDQAWVGIKTSLSGRKYLAAGKYGGSGSFPSISLENNVFNSTKSSYKLPKQGSTLIGCWVRVDEQSTQGRFPSMFNVYHIDGTSSSKLTSVPFLPLGSETFVEIHIDFDNNKFDIYHNGINVTVGANTVNSLADYVLYLSAPAVSSSNASGNRWCGLGPIIVAHNNPGDPNPTTSLAGMEVLPIKVETVVEQNGWASSDETKTIPEVLDPSVDTELTNTDSPFVIASPDELISKYRFNVPNIAGSMHYVNLGVRAGSAPGRTDKVQTLLSFKNSISDFVEFDTAENMETHVIASANKTPSGGNWTINDLNTLELWMNAKSSTSDNPYPFDVGPGPKELIAGDFNAGYFGTVTADEFISNIGLSDALNLNAIDHGTLYDGSPTDVWFKFFWKARIIFIPQRPFRYAVAFRNIYQSGLAYGTDDFGVVVPDLVPTNQMRTLSVLGYNFKARLMNGVDETLWTEGPGVITSASSFHEAGNLLMRVCGAHEVNNWDTYNPEDLFIPGSTNGARNYVINASPNGDSVACIHHTNGTWEWTSSVLNSTNANRGWRPVLELIPD